MASYAEIIEAVAGILRNVDGIGKVAAIDDEDGPNWERHPRANSAYWEIDLVSEERQGMTAAGRAGFEILTLTVDGFMPVNEATRSHKVWLALIKAVQTAIGADTTLGGVVHSIAEPGIARNEKGVARWGDTGKEFGCHHCTIELRVKQYATWG